MPRIKITVAYDGKNYSGWQIQETRFNLPPTIQGELEKAIFQLTGNSIRVHGSGRTDAGVHAEGQVAHFDIGDSYNKINWLRAFQAKLPPDIVVTEAVEVDDSFHARFSAKSKIYTYSLWLDQNIVLPRVFQYSWACGHLNVSAMDQASMNLIGKHDFSTFQNTGSLVQDTVKDIYSIKSFYAPLPGSYADPIKPDMRHLCWQISGDGFLKQMVRNIIGLLVYVGMNKIPPEICQRVLAAKNRSSYSFPTAPAHGLTLTNVNYI